MRSCLLIALLVSCTSGLAQTSNWPTGSGFPNLARTQGELLSGPNAPGQGRTSVIAWHNGVLVTIPQAPSSQPDSDLTIRMWNISNPANPQVINRLGWTLGDANWRTQSAIAGHGYLHIGQNMTTGGPGNFLVFGPDRNPAANSFSLNAVAGTPGLARGASGSLGVYAGRGSLFQPWHIDQTWWSYNAIGGNAEIRLGGAGSNSTLLGRWDHLAETGVIGHPVLLGNLLYFLSEQSRTGIAVYDISDPAQPSLISTFKIGGPGGYWPELWGGNGKLYAVFPYNLNGNGVRIVDVTDPTNMVNLADVALPGDSAQYAQFQDEFGFIGAYKFDMRTLQSVYRFRTNTWPVVSERTGVNMSQHAMPLGNLLVTGGIGEGQGMAIWAHQAAPDTRPPSVGWHVPRNGQTNYPRKSPLSFLIHETLDTLSIIGGTTLLVRQVTGANTYGPHLAGKWAYSFNDVLTYTPNADLPANATIEVRLAGIKDAAGNPMEPYAFTFSTGSTVGGNRPPVVASLSVSAYPAAPNTSVTASAFASDPDAGNTLSYRFDFGDGSAPTAWSSSSTAQRTYANVGRYGLSVQVRDSAGAISSRSTTVTVLRAPSGPRSTASSPIHCDNSGRRVWVVNPDNDSIAEINADTRQRLREVAVCDDPRNIVRAGGKTWITCKGDDRIAILNGNALSYIDLGYGAAPHGIAATPDGAAVLVALEGKGSVRRFSTSNAALTGELSLGPRPRALTIAADGSHALVTRLISPSNHAEVWRVDLGPSLTLTDTTKLYKFGTASNRDTPASGKGVPNFLTSIAYSPLDARAFIAANKPNNERGKLIDATADLDEDNTVRNLAIEIDPARALTANARVARVFDIDNSDSASAIAYSPLGDYVLVALQGNDNVAVFDALGDDLVFGNGRLATRLQAGAAPQGICVDLATGRSFVQNLADRTVTAYDTDPLFRFGAVTLDGPNISTVSSDPTPTAIKLGKRLFYHAGDPRMSAEGYVSCASCHLDGGHDGRVWDFTGRGEGLRNTIALWGRAGTGHGNVHWSGNFDEIHDFEGDIRRFQGGTGFLTDAQFANTANPLGAAKAGLSADLDALASFVTSLGTTSAPRSPYRTSTGALTATAQQGRDVYLREGCAGCHTSPRFTMSAVGNGNLSDVGTLRTTSGQRLTQTLTGIDVPTLYGLFDSAPYFHDGSAATLGDVFRSAGGVVVQAESGVLSGGATILTGTTTTNTVDYNDDTVRSRGYVMLGAAAHRVRLNGIPGGNGGTGAIEVRYSASQFRTSMNVNVNGTTRSLPIVPAENLSDGRPVNWLTARLEDVPLNAGAGNYLELSTAGFYVAVDEVLVSRASDLSRAQPHRRVSVLPSGEQQALQQFLLQLDRPVVAVDALFMSSFE